MGLLRALARAFSQRLYLRIWLAVVGGVALLTLLVGWAWRIAAEQNTAPPTPPTRDIVLLGGSGEVVLAGQAQRLPGPPAEGVEWRIEGRDGQDYRPMARVVDDLAAGHARPGHAVNTSM